MSNKKPPEGGARVAKARQQLQSQQLVQPQFSHVVFQLLRLILVPAVHGIGLGRQHRLDNMVVRLRIYIWYSSLQGAVRVP